MECIRKHSVLPPPENNILACDLMARSSTAAPEIMSPVDVGTCIPALKVLPLKNLSLKSSVASMSTSPVKVGPAKFALTLKSTFELSSRVSGAFFKLFESLVSPSSTKSPPTGVTSVCDEIIALFR